MTDKDVLRGQMAGMKSNAIMVVKRHAAIYTPDVPAPDVESICGALGEISVDEAMGALNRLQSDINENLKLSPKA